MEEIDKLAKKIVMRLCYRQWRSGDVSLGYRLRMMCEADTFGSTPESNARMGRVLCVYVRIAGLIVERSKFL